VINNFVFLQTACTAMVTQHRFRDDKNSWPPNSQLSPVDYNCVLIKTCFINSTS